MARVHRFRRVGTVFWHTRPKTPLIRLQGVVKDPSSIAWRLGQASHHLESWLVAVREANPDSDPIPGYVEREFRSFLSCGVLARGFSRCKCSNPGCGYEYILAFSCRGRGVCTSCGAKYMVQTAAHLVDNVLPRVPYRQWVLTVPRRLRFFLQRNPKHAGGVLNVLMRTLQTTIRNCSPHAPPGSKFGAVSFQQRAGSAINPHLHYHVVATDGVFALREDGEVEFFALKLRGLLR